jgi:hypothetical protein
MPEKVWLDSMNPGAENGPGFRYSGGCDIWRGSMRKKSNLISLSPETIPANASTADLIPAADRRIFKRRWAELAPWILLDLYRNGIPSPQQSAEFAEYRNLHRNVLARLLRLGLDMRTVRRNLLDDPRISEDERTDRVRNYINKRKSWIFTMSLWPSSF